MDSNMTEDQARETVSRMFDEMGRTMNSIAGLSESEYETDSDQEPSKEPPKKSSVNPNASSTATITELDAPEEPKKKKKKKRKKKSNMPDLEDYLNQDQPLEPEDAYDLSKSAAERVEIAVTKFRKNRKFNNERSQIFSAYLEYGGIKTGPKMFQGGASKPAGVDDDDGEPDYEAMNAGIDRVDLPEDGQEVDFTNLVTTFLSQHFLKCTGWIDMIYYKDTPLVIASLLSYFLVRNVLPEYEQDIRSALAIAEQAKIELPLCKTISCGWPGRYDKACSLLYGGEWYGFLDASWQDQHVLIDTLGMDRPTAERIVQSLIGPDVDLKSITVSPREYLDMEIIKIDIPPEIQDNLEEPESPTESQLEENPELVAMVDNMLLGKLSDTNSTPGNPNSLGASVAEILMPLPPFACVTFAVWDSDLPREEQKPVDQRRHIQVYFDIAMASKMLLGMRVTAYVYTLSNGMSYLHQAEILPTFYLEADEIEVPWDEWSNDS
ncbi:hypothetical protein BGZ76_011310 [Entomortierella beljakovae]|nr:hypothetical protein BGZ76_011310 [Entomortierella beljakovae]